MHHLEDYKTFILIPEDTFEEFIQAIRDLRKIKSFLEKDSDSGTRGDYIDENEAMKILRRGKTWFWNKRKSRELPGKKAAGRWYYKLMDIDKLIDNGRSV